MTTRLPIPISPPPAYPVYQDRNRDRLYEAHRKLLDVYWDDAGRFIGAGRSGDLRIALWHSMAFLAGDARCVEKAHRIILAHYDEAPCMFATGAAIDLLLEHRPRLRPDLAAKLERYVRLTLPYMVTEDLKIRGGNDNHPHKAMHALILGGEMLGLSHFVDFGVARLRQAVDYLSATGFPCEYCSPTYTPISLHPLASIAELARSEEARGLALRLERFYWQDLALHYDPRAGVPAGPFSRTYITDTDGLLSTMQNLLLHLFPERFGLDLVEELYVKREQTDYVAPFTKTEFCFFIAHPVWAAGATYHMTPDLERALFERPAGSCIRGTAENNCGALRWTKPDDIPAGAPAEHVRGPRKGLLTTYFGKGYSLGTSQYGWTDQTQTFNAVVTRSLPGVEKIHLRRAAPYYACLFFDENYPWSEWKTDAPPPDALKDEGESRILQHENTALVFYNPLPKRRQARRIRTGIFRPLAFTSPEEIYVGEKPVADGNLIWPDPEPIAIRDGDVYIGIRPMLWNNVRQGRKAVLQIHTFSDHLAILLSAFEDWTPREFSYAELLEVHAGFSWEMHDADAFPSFEAFRRQLAEVTLVDDCFLSIRTAAYARPGLSLTASYSPFQTAFFHTAANGRPFDTPSFRIDGMPDPGASLCVG